MMQLTALRPVLDQAGPFVTVHAEVARPTEDAHEAFEAQWTSIRHALGQHDVDSGLVEEIHARLEAAPAMPGPLRRTLVAAGTDVLLDEVVAGELTHPGTVDLSRLPDVTPWLREADRQIRFLLVLTDHEGAEIELHQGFALPGTRRDEVHGQDFQITKVAAGDWAQKQYQQYAENAWKQNAELVAERIRDLVERERPQLVLIAGPDRAQSDLDSTLEGLEVPVVKVASGGGAAGASREALWSEVRRVLAETEADRDDAVAGELAARAGRGDGTVVFGLDEMVSALNQSRVEQVVMDPEVVSGLTVDPGDYPGLTLPAGVDGVLPADRVLIAAAATSDASCTTLPREMTEGPGVAALLRWGHPS